MNKNLQLLFATGNQGKIIELTRIFSNLPVIFKTLRDFDDIAEVAETGSTYLENAVLKARSYAEQTGIAALSDDSGLEITALNNAPGVRSARYAGVNAGFDEKMRILLNDLDAVGDVERAARFVCVMALVNKQGETQFTAEGVCKGTIAREPRGNGGFGYDPIFVPAGFDMSFAELASDIKQKISHRGRASAIIYRFLLDFMAV